MALFRCGGGSGGGSVYFGKQVAYGNISTDGKKPKRFILSFYYSGTSYVETEIYDEDVSTTHVTAFVNGAAASQKQIGGSGTITASVSTSGVNVNSGSAFVNGVKNFSYMIEV